MHTFLTVPPQQSNWTQTGPTQHRDSFLFQPNFTDAIRCLCSNAVFAFLWILATLGSEDIVPIVGSLDQMQICKPKPSLVKPLKQAILVQSVSKCPVMNFNISHVVHLNILLGKKPNATTDTCSAEVPSWILQHLIIYGCINCACWQVGDNTAQVVNLAFTLNDSGSSPPRAHEHGNSTPTTDIPL